MVLQDAFVELLKRAGEGLVRDEFRVAVSSI
jgi:hypothetical protein